MRFPFRIMCLMTTLGASACGALSDGTLPGADPSPQPPSESGASHGGLRPSEVAQSDLVPRGVFVRPPTRISGRAVVSALPRLYFMATPRQPAMPDVAVLRAVGTESVDIEGATIVDDPMSPFGIGAAAHFGLVMPVNRRIEPGQEAEIEVHFLTDTTDLQNAVLEIYTNADNAGVVRVHLTGKFFETR